VAYDRVKPTYYKVNSTYRSFARQVSQLKVCDFSGEIFKGFEVCYGVGVLVMGNSIP
jgi:hypothetical protein